ncbi:hypothetical protein SAMD00023353_0900680 [Rosellinia necatrix]|uniref:Uncharacterized protein n=1 Tax=Rosellinia necatrix TaxID=77044 RepID=A0A1S8A643_ROSNE|nr:hypothetical protein SAMD00023353_0900680 [Rosellinia necatrix]
MTLKKVNGAAKSNKPSGSQPATGGTNRPAGQSGNNPPTSAAQGRNGRANSGNGGIAQFNPAPARRGSDGGYGGSRDVPRSAPINIPKK